MYTNEANIDKRCQAREFEESSIHSGGLFVSKACESSEKPNAIQTYGRASKSSTPMKK